MPPEISKDDLFRVLFADVRPYTLIGGYENLPSLGPLKCRHRIPWRVLEAPDGYWQHPEVRVALERMPTSLSLMGMSNGYMNLAIPVGDAVTRRDAQVEWLKHGQRLCWVPVDSTHGVGEWVKVSYRRVD